ncbi:MAG: hypothetical protein MHM6MM_003895 [Cercozoa sp. M6MM]
MNADSAVEQRVAQAHSSGKFSVTGFGISELPASLFEPGEEVARRRGRQTPDLGGFSSGERWWHVEPIRLVDASVNEIEVLPQELTRLLEVEAANFKRNRIRDVPNLLSWQRLKKLDLSHNALTSESLREMCTKTESSVVWLSLAHNQLTRIPDFVFDLPLQHLDLSNNKIEVSEEDAERLCRMRSLRSLDLSRNRVSLLPPSLLQLCNLQHLSLSHNCLTMRYPVDMSSMAALVELDLSYNALTSLPALGSGNIALTRLVAARNKLAQLGDDLSQLPALVHLSLSDNDLQHVPASLASMPMIRVIDLRNNALEEVPGELGFVQSLHALHVDGNPMRRMKRALLLAVQSMAKLKQYLCSRVQDAQAAHSRSNSSGMGIPVATEEEALTAVELVAKRRAEHSRKLLLRDAGLERLSDALFATLTQIERVDLHNNRLCSLPDGIRQCNRIKSVVLSKNYNIHGIPAPVWDLPVSELSLSSCRLACDQLDREFLDAIVRHSPENAQLAQAVQSGLQQTANPQNIISQLRQAARNVPLVQHLTTLDLSSSGLTRVPLFVPCCSQLRELTLSGNRISSNLLSAGLCAFGHSLYTLWLSNNSLERLDPAIFVRHSQLTQLAVDNNALRFLPFVLSTLPLRSLAVTGNPLRTLRQNVIARGVGSILQSLRERGPSPEEAAILQREEHMMRNESSEQFGVGPVTAAVGRQNRPSVRVAQQPGGTQSFSLFGGVSQLPDSQSQSFQQQQQPQQSQQQHHQHQQHDFRHQYHEQQHQRQHQQHQHRLSHQQHQLDQHQQQQRQQHQQQRQQHQQHHQAFASGAGPVTAGHGRQNRPSVRVNHRPGGEQHFSIFRQQPELQQRAQQQHRSVQHHRQERNHAHAATGENAVPNRTQHGLHSHAAYADASGPATAGHGSQSRPSVRVQQQPGGTQSFSLFGTPPHAQPVNVHKRGDPQQIAEIEQQIREISEQLQIPALSKGRIAALRRKLVAKQRLLAQVK